MLIKALLQLCMGLVVRKPVLWVRDKARLQPTCSATVTRRILKFCMMKALIALIYFAKSLLTKVLTRTNGCAGWSKPLLFACIKIRFYSQQGQLSCIIKLLSWSGVDKIGVSYKRGSRPNIECWLCSFVIFQGIRTSIAKNPIFCDFSGWVWTPCPPLWIRT